MPCLIACFLAIRRSSVAIRSIYIVKRIGDRAAAQSQRRHENR